MDQFSWIKNYKNNENINALIDIIPDLFAQYYLIHWKIGIMDDFPFEKYPSNNITIEENNKRIKIEREFGLFLNPQKSNCYKEISLDELSQKFKLEKNKICINLITELSEINEELQNLKTSDTLNQPFLNTFERLLKFDMIKCFDNVKIFFKKVNPNFQIDDI